MRRILNENKVIIDKVKVDSTLETLISTIEGVFISNGFTTVLDAPKHVNAKNLGRQIIVENFDGFYYIGLDYEFGLFNGEDDAVSVWASKITKEASNLEDFLNGELDTGCYKDILISLSPLDEVTIANIAKQIVILIHNNSYR